MPQLMTQSFGAELRSNEGIPVRDFWVIEGRRTAKTVTSAPTLRRSRARC